MELYEDLILHYLTKDAHVFVSPRSRTCGHPTPTSRLGKPKAGDLRSSDLVVRHKSIRVQHTRR
jgi:hypothetical protein